MVQSNIKLRDENHWHIRNTGLQLLLRKTHHPSGGPPSVLVSGRCLLHSTISLNCFLPYSLLFALLWTFSRSSEWCQDIIDLFPHLLNACSLGCLLWSVSRRILPFRGTAFWRTKFSQELFVNSEFRLLSRPPLLRLSCESGTERYVMRI